MSTPLIVRGLVDELGEIRVIEGTPVPAAVGGPADDDAVLADLAELVDEPSDN